MYHGTREEGTPAGEEENNACVPGHLHEEAPEASARRQSSCCRQWRQQQRAVPAVPPWCRAAARAGPIATFAAAAAPELACSAHGWRCGALALASLACRPHGLGYRRSLRWIALGHCGRTAACIQVSTKARLCASLPHLQRNALLQGDAMPCRTLIAMRHDDGRSPFGR